MTAITVSEARQASPNAGVKRVVIRTDAAAATGYTYDASLQGFTTLWSVYVNDDTGVVKTATWSSLVVTLGTISTGVHTLVLEGI
jgi:hypothetical protein